MLLRVMIFLLFLGLPCMAAPGPLTSLDTYSPGTTRNDQTSAKNFRNLSRRWSRVYDGTASLEVSSVVSSLETVALLDATSIEADGAFITTLTATDITAETISLTSQPGFSAYRASGKSIATGTETTIDFTTERYDIGGDFDSTTGIFTAPSDGIYTFSWGVWSGSAIWATGHIWYARCYLNDTTAVADSGLQTQVAGTYAISANGSIILQLSTGDTVRIKVYHTRGLNTLTATIFQCYFSGHKIS